MFSYTGFGYFSGRMIFRLGNRAGVGLTHCFSVSLMLMVLYKTDMAANFLNTMYRGMEDGSKKGGERVGGCGKVSDAV